MSLGRPQTDTDVSRDLHACLSVPECVPKRAWCEQVYLCVELSNP